MISEDRKEYVVFKYQVKVLATGEVRDAEGNLISEPTIEKTMYVTEAELAELRESNKEK
jgi:hypothetical protein